MQNLRKTLDLARCSATAVIAPPCFQQTYGTTHVCLQVDAFATEPFTGNPAAVCLLQAGMPQKLQTTGLQDIAAELKQPAACFVTVLREQDSFQTSNRFALKWFSPSQELPLCGHGTLAAAAALVQGDRGTA